MNVRHWVLLVLAVIGLSLALPNGGHAQEAVPAVQEAPPAAQEAAPTAREAPPAAAQSYPEGLVHTVVEGDTLWDLSAKYLGSPWKWQELWERNRFVTNPHYIYPGIDIVVFPPPAREYALAVAEPPPVKPAAPPAEEAAVVPAPPPVPTLAISPSEFVR